MEYELPKQYQISKKETKVMTKIAKKLLAIAFWFMIGIIMGSIIKLVYGILK